MGTYVNCGTRGFLKTQITSYHIGFERKNNRSIKKVTLYTKKDGCWTFYEDRHPVDYIIRQLEGK